MKSLFCDKCGTLLKIEVNESGVLTGSCICGFTKERHYHVITSEKIKKKEEVGKGISKEKDEDGGEGFPHKCKKCGYGECTIFQIGAPYADESDIYLYKCRKCKFIERQADGTGNK